METMTQILLRRAAALGMSVLTAWVGIAHAADPDADPLNTRADRHLACLQAPMPTALEASGPADGSPRLLRARLTFTAGDVAPSVEWLWKDAPGAVAPLEQHLRGYRMPCFEPDGGPQWVVQEFWVTPGTGKLEVGEVWPTYAGPPGPGSCYESTETNLEQVRSLPKMAKVLAFFRFVEGREAPEVKVGYHIGSSAFLKAVRSDVERYRRCADGRTDKSWHEQLFQYVPETAGQPKFKPMEFRAFLRQVKEPEKLRAHFDLSTMRCPFQVAWKLNQPAMKNDAVTMDDKDDDRRAFLGWLGSLKLDLPAATEAVMFGESMTISVPCLLINLQPQQ